MLEQTVDKLVAASERPDLKYQVTILNSPAVNAFALPNGQLYVTRGLIALANDNSELASVLAHEMAHVIARHAAIREDQARQAALVNRVATDLLSDPQLGALALAKSKIALASFSRAQEFEADGIGVGISARAGFDPYGAQRFLTSMGQNAHLQGAAQPASIRARRTSCRRIRRRRSASPTRIANARQFTGARRRRSATRPSISPCSTAWSYGEDPSEGFVRGRRFLHPKLGFTFTAPEGFTLDNTAQAVFGVKDGGAQALRLDVVRVPAEQTLAGLSDLRLDREHRSEERRGHHDQRLPGRDRDRERRPMDASGSTRCASAARSIASSSPPRTAPRRSTAASANSIDSFRRMIARRDAASAKPLRLKVVTVQAAATRSSGWPAAWRSPTARSSGSACSTGFGRRTR